MNFLEDVQYALRKGRVMDRWKRSVPPLRAKQRHCIGVSSLLLSERVDEAPTRQPLAFHAASTLL